MRLSSTAMHHRRTHWIRPPGPVAPGLKIGLLGGSFNPAHCGHVHVSEMALKRLGLDYVWWLVAPQNPLKPTIGMAPLENRLKWCADEALDPRIRVMDIEADLGTRFTIDTLHALKSRFPGVRFVWLMGSDNLSSFRRWRRWDEVFGEVPIAVIMRPGYTLAPIHAKAAQRFSASRLPESQAARLAFTKPPCFVVLDGRRDPMSASAIRAGAQSASPMAGAIPA